MKAIKNPWIDKNKDGTYKTFTPNQVDALVFESGDYRIFKQSGNCYLHTYKDMGITQRCKAYKEGVARWKNGDFSEVMDYRVENCIKLQKEATK